MFSRIVRFGSFVLVVLASIFCSEIAYSADSCSSNAESQNMDSVQRLFSAVDQLHGSVPFNISALEKIFGCKFTVQDNFPSGPYAISQGLNSMLIKQVEAFLPDDGPRSNTGGKVFIYLKSSTSVTIDQVKRHFGIDASTFTDMAAENQPVQSEYHRKWGLLTFLCPHGGKTVQRIWLVE